MITLREIKAAIVNVLKTKYPECRVHFDNVENRMRLILCRTDADSDNSR